MSDTPVGLKRFNCSSSLLLYCLASQAEVNSKYKRKHNKISDAAGKRSISLQSGALVSNGHNRYCNPDVDKLKKI